MWGERVWRDVVGGLRFANLLCGGVTMGTLISMSIVACRETPILVVDTRRGRGGHQTLVVWRPTCDVAASARLKETPAPKVKEEGHNHLHKEADTTNFNSNSKAV